MPASPFLNTQAVETWDTWFRWRDRGHLRDLTIEYTWERVAAALAASRPDAARPGYQRRLFDAFSAWQLLLDQRVLATAGTAAPQWDSADLTAALNIASFVRAPGLPHASIDHALLEEVAALAVYALDDAALLGSKSPLYPAGSLHIGVIGLGNALEFLGLAYDSAAACREAERIAASLASGCLAGSIALARDHVSGQSVSSEWQRRANARAHARELTAAVERYGLRYANLTAISSQQRLACFANGVADAMDPNLQRACVQPACGPLDARRATLDTDAVVDNAQTTTLQRPSVPAQLRLRAAVQPWIDAHIQYPLIASEYPSDEQLRAWNNLAADLDLSPVTWRSMTRDCRNVRSERCVAR